MKKYIKLVEACVFIITDAVHVIWHLTFYDRVRHVEFSFNVVRIRMELNCHDIRLSSDGLSTCIVMISTVLT